MGKRSFKHLTLTDRLTMDKMLRKGYAEKEVANVIGVHVSTIYREKRRGRYMHTNTDLTEEERYSPDIANNKYRENLRAKGAGLKIGKDRKLADWLEGKILNEDYSPGAALGEIKEKGMKFDTQISKTTLYRYIEIGVFRQLSNEKLPVKGSRTKRNKKVRRKQSRASAGDSIEKRPEAINTREEFGHWEMDTVVGKRGESKHSLLVLTERKTRYEIIKLLDEHTMGMVVRRIDEIEADFGDKFREVFKTITVDNGTEFSDCAGIEKSSLHDGSRTKLYYCHPYSSYERGSNENQNKLIRRKIPKGVNFDDRTEEDIKFIQDWINNYPRKLFDYENARSRFERELNLVA